ncbi:unnamed protein product [Mytilus edulis]|uniref:Uncharacterized protein n=1 Tax=Mytilus edulis TaxID=6550 RepID=A0A8S3TL52_MYTED|nr:unnamed protein product [Mytilus edulis]
MTQQLGWEPLEHRRARSRVIMFYKIINHIVEVPVHHLLSHHDTRTRGSMSNNIRQIRTRLDCFKYSFIPATIISWNNIPPDIRASPSVEHFRHAIQDIQVIAVVLSCNSYRTDAEDVKKVHIIFMNHLDVGYDGLLPEELGFINNVLNKYFVEYFPRAIILSEQLRMLGYYERFIYTTHPWLVSLYLNCPPNLILSGIKLKCPNATELSSFVNAVKQGDITWHAGPMNMQFEVMDVELARFGIKLSKDLDDKMNIVRKFRTLSQRDVPAMTQGIVPILEEEGVAAISVGVNTVTAPPAVPPIFRWKFQNSSVIGIWHPG